MPNFDKNNVHIYSKAHVDADESRIVFISAEFSVLKERLIHFGRQDPILCQLIAA